MSDTQGTDAGEQQLPPVIINGQYIKDLSFEAPNSPNILGELQGQQPEINVDVNVASTKLENSEHPNLYEVVLTLNGNLTLDGKTGFVIELQYAGVFTLNLPEEHHHAFMMIECPRILFPYARQILSDTTQQGGFMPLYLQPIDFAALYQNRLGAEAADLEQQMAGMIHDKAD